eukprot:scaffold119983_cov57-Phaeocystis_antarctica.AAC.1
MFYVGMFTAREAAAIAWSAFLCVSASFLRSADVRPAPPPGCRTAHNRVGIVCAGWTPGVPRAAARALRRAATALGGGVL